MVPLSKTNKYLADPENFRRMIAENARASSIFEGASPRALDVPAPCQVSRKVTASTKKSVKGSKRIA